MVDFELGELVGMRGSLAKLLNVDLPIPVSYKLGKVVKKINDELQNFEKKRMDLVKKYGEEDKEKKQFSVKEENTEKFMKDINDLLAVKVSFEIEQIPLDLLDGAKLSAVDMNSLEKFIKSTAEK